MFPPRRPFSIRSERQPHGYTVHIEGELDAATVADLESEGVRLPFDAPVVVNLRGVTILDSTAIGFLHQWYERLVEHDSGMSIEVSDPTLDELFRICGLTDRLGVVLVE